MNIDVLVNQRTSWSALFNTAFTQQCNSLAVPGRVTEQTTVPAKGADVLLYFCDPSHAVDAAEEAALATYLDAGGMILPVLNDAPDAVHLPQAIKHINAFIIAHYPVADWPAALVDETISTAWLRRRTRLIFISYKRDDSEAVAHQLHRGLTERGYEVFLDDLSIVRGIDFQRELMWRLNDADAVLVLASPNLDSSSWVAKEIHFAQSSMIELMTIVWPSVDEKKSALLSAVMEDQVHRLVPADLVGTRPKEQSLKDPAHGKVLRLVLDRRVQSINRRLRHLLPFARDHLSREYAVTVTERLGELDLIHNTTSETLRARVLPFRPTLDSFYDLREQAHGYQSIGVFYEENDPKHRRSLALAHFADGQWPAPMTRQRIWQFSAKVKP